jgi:hypothetical protein
MIRPVEMQMILPQANQVGMQQHNVEQHAALQSSQGTNEFVKEVQEHAETVIPKEDPNLLEFGYDAREKGSNTYDDFFLKRRKKRKAQEESKDSKEENNQNQDKAWVNFDIKI